MALFQIVILTVMAVTCLSQCNSGWTIREPAVANRLALRNTSLEAICTDICNHGFTTTVYPGDCLLYIMCNPTGNIIDINSCSQGTYFNNGGKYCDWPTSLSPSDCDGTGNPCRPGYRLADKIDGCGYYECPNGTTAHKVCPPGTGFDFGTSSCTTSAVQYCTSNQYREIRTACGPLAGTTSAYNKTVYEWVDGKGVSHTDPFSVNVSCPAETEYLSNNTFCNCTLKASRNPVCADKQLVNLDSATGSWSASARGDPGFYKLMGNLTLETTGTYAGQAYVKIGSNLAIPSLAGNSLGKSWNVTMTITAGIKVNGTFQTGLVAGTPNSPDITLLENGGCNATATYSLRIRPLSSTSGSVVATVNSHSVTSVPVPLTATFTATLSQNNTLGRLVVWSGATKLDEKTFSFAAGEEVAANPCPLTIGTGSGQQPYTGYADKIFLFKYACS